MSEITSQLSEEEEKAKNLGKVKNKQEMLMVDLEGKRLRYPPLQSRVGSFMQCLLEQREGYPPPK